jgi:tetratricopeptide (TPR) repeat protein
LLEAANGTEVVKVARDSSKAVLIRPQADAELVEAAAVLADQAADRSPNNLWSVLTLGMSHYRQDKLAKADECLHRAAEAPGIRLSLLAQVFLAMTKFRQGEVQAALEQLEKAEKGLGLVAVIDLQSPFVLHHDELAVWLALQEARRLMKIEPDANQDAVDRLLAFQREAVEKAFTDTERSLHLAVLYAWFKREAAHRDLSRQLIDAARKSQQPGDLERAAKAYLVCPEPESGLLASAALCAEEAVGLWEHNHGLQPWAQMAAGMAAYRQQRYVEAVEFLTDAQRAANRLIKGPSLLFRSMANLRQGHRERARKDFVAAVELMKPVPDRTTATEAVLDDDELVFWLAYVEANRELTAEGLPVLADD